MSSLDVSNFIWGIADDVLRDVYVRGKYRDVILPMTVLRRLDANPPYGKSWKTDLHRMGGKKGMGDPRFVIDHADDPEYSLVTRTNDGQMLFLANKLSKVKRDTKLGSRIAEVHNGSSLFTGSAGQGESNIRRWIIGSANA